MTASSLPTTAALPTPLCATPELHPTPPDPQHLPGGWATTSPPVQLLFCFASSAPLKAPCFALPPSRQPLFLLLLSQQYRLPPWQALISFRRPSPRPPFSSVCWLPTQAASVP